MTRLAGEAQLASIGLLSFAAIAQTGAGLFRRPGVATRHSCAIAGMTAGFLVRPILAASDALDIGVIGERILTDGPAGLTAASEHLLCLDLPPLVHGVLRNLVNIACFIGFSFRRAPSPIQRRQGEHIRRLPTPPISPSSGSGVLRSPWKN